MAAVFQESRIQEGVGPREIASLEDLTVQSLDRSRSMSPSQAMRALVRDGADQLPLPGAGNTLRRWRVLARVAARDLALVKLFEGHTDALAIIEEIEPRRRPAAGVVYGVWASEGRTDPMTVLPSSIDPDASALKVSGRKSWCSGATRVDRALMTAVDAAGGRHLIDIALDSDGIAVDRSRWNAIGMQGSESFDVVCDRVSARRVGGPGAYLDRPGFWHGGAGIAACWHGAAVAIGDRVRDLQRDRDDVHALAHLGAIDADLASGAALLRECAAAIDARPDADAMHLVLRVRGAIADMAERVLDHAARALGPGPLCNESDLARRFADLPIFVRQSRAEHDRVAAARALLTLDQAQIGWTL